MCSKIDLKLNGVYLFESNSNKNLFVDFSIIKVLKQLASELSI